MLYINTTQNKELGIRISSKSYQNFKISRTPKKLQQQMEIVLENRRITIRAAEDVGMSVGSCHDIF